ncbi:hypothetical protein DRQ25_11235 [Candidatus Fermentibacteria bacterium]|nr:MAG: hypothetical protein DRQ25_11235 [Candidatus Fermentibacteria bacterium]
MLDVLFSKTRRNILVLFFTHPDKGYHIREVVRCIQGGRGAVVRELNALAEAGILVRESKGNLVIYQANRDCPVFQDIHNLIVKTGGIADVIRSALSNLDGISYCFIFGSTSRGELDQISDVDVFVIGEVTFTEVSKALHSAQTTLGRNISPVVYSDNEFTVKVSQRNHFIMNVLNKPIIMLIGGEDDLRAMGSE